MKITAAPLLFQKYLEYFMVCTIMLYMRKALANLCLKINQRINVMDFFYNKDLGIGEKVRINCVPFAWLWQILINYKYVGKIQLMNGGSPHTLGLGLL